MKEQTDGDLGSVRAIKVLSKAVVPNLFKALEHL
jgi:hypothetical protein